MTEKFNMYDAEIFNFLRTVTIKFIPFAYNMGESYMAEHGMTSPEFKENPYYQRLAGNYCAGDMRMTVTTVEDGSVVEYNKELINTYPQTAALYRIPNNEYFTLEEKYPDNVGLIRTITYPVKDIDAAIAAPNLSLLAYDDSLLETNEREDMILCIKEFLNMVRTRWWIDEFVYEELYPVVFWGMLWQQLAAVLLTRRFVNIKTPYVHSMHIWEYLKSKGLSDYRDVLTTKQANWLYRNIDYIRANRGKNSTLRILAENLLPDVSASLLYKDMYQETESRYDKELSTNPIFRSYKLTTDEHIRDETFTELNDKLVNLGAEHRNDAEFVNEQELALACHKYNILSTKFLEFKKEPIDTRYLQLMNNFFLDSMYYSLHKGKLLYDCVVYDPLSSSEYDLSIGNTILLWHYAIWKSQGITPVSIPTKAVCHIPFRHTYPGDENITKFIYSAGQKYLVSNILDLKSLKNTIPWTEVVYGNAKDFINYLAKGFTAYLTVRIHAEQSNRKEYHDALMQYLSDVSAPGVLELKLTNYDNFEQWTRSSEIFPIIEAYSDISDAGDLSVHYGKLANACFNAIFPIELADIQQHIRSVKSTENIYRAIRDLFIQLGSYNVFYLETERDSNEYLTLRDPDVNFPIGMDISADDIFSWTHENYAVSVKYNIEPIIDSVTCDVGISGIMPDTDMESEIGHDANITDIQLIFSSKFTTPVANELTNFTINWSCDTLPLTTDMQYFKIQDI